MPPKINKYGLASGWLGINFLLSLVVFALAIFTTPFIAQIPTMTEGNWFWFFLARVGLFSLPLIWFFASTGFYLAAFLADKKKIVWMFFGVAVGILISGFFCRHYYLDLFSGSATIRGRVTDSEIRRDEAIFYHYIDSRVVFVDEAGEEYIFNSVGNKAVQWEEFLWQVEQDKTQIDLTVLPHTGFLLDYTIAK